MKRAQRQLPIPILWFEEAVAHERQKEPMRDRKASKLQAITCKVFCGATRFAGRQQASLRSDMPVQIDRGQGTGPVEGPGVRTHRASLEAHIAQRSQDA